MTALITEENRQYPRVYVREQTGLLRSQGDFGGVEPPKSRERSRKSSGGGFSGAFPSEFYRMLAWRIGQGFRRLCSFDCSTAVKGEFLLNLQRRFRWLKPTQTLGENSCFPLKPFSACYRVLHGFSVSRRFAPVPRSARSASGGLEPFSEEKGSKNSKKTLCASRCSPQVRRKLGAVRQDSMPSCTCDAN